MAHLEHKPLPLRERPSDELVCNGDFADGDECWTEALETSFDHLAARRRAEGADMPPQADEPPKTYRTLLALVGLSACLFGWVAYNVIPVLWRMFNG